MATLGRVLVTFKYLQPGLQPPIYLAGSFSNPQWQPEEMLYTSDEKNEHLFIKQIELEEGQEYQYKFRIGLGDWWVLDEDAPTVTDSAGNRNNLLIALPFEKKETSKRGKDSDTGFLALLDDRAWPAPAVSSDVQKKRPPPSNNEHEQSVGEHIKQCDGSLDEKVTQDWDQENTGSFFPDVAVQFRPTIIRSASYQVEGANSKEPISGLNEAQINNPRAMNEKREDASRVRGSSGQETTEKGDDRAILSGTCAMLSSQTLLPTASSPQDLEPSTLPQASPLSVMRTEENICSIRGAVVGFGSKQNTWHLPLENSTTECLPLIQRIFSQPTLGAKEFKAVILASDPQDLFYLLAKGARKIICQTSICSIPNPRQTFTRETSIEGTRSDGGRSPQALGFDTNSQSQALKFSKTYLSQLDFANKTYHVGVNVDISSLGDGDIRWNWPTRSVASQERDINITAFFSQPPQGLQSIKCELPAESITSLPLICDSDESDFSHRLVGDARFSEGHAQFILDQSACATPVGMKRYFPSMTCKEEICSPIDNMDSEVILQILSHKSTMRDGLANILQNKSENTDTRVKPQEERLGLAQISTIKYNTERDTRSERPNASCNPGAEVSLADGNTRLGARKKSMVAHPETNSTAPNIDSSNQEELETSQWSGKQDETSNCDRKDGTANPQVLNEAQPKAIHLIMSTVESGKHEVNVSAVQSTSAINESSPSVPTGIVSVNKQITLSLETLGTLSPQDANPNILTRPLIVTPLFVSNRRLGDHIHEISTGDDAPHIQIIPATPSPVVFAKFDGNKQFGHTDESVRKDNDSASYILTTSKGRGRTEDRPVTPNSIQTMGREPTSRNLIRAVLRFVFIEFWRTLFKKMARFGRQPPNNVD